MSRRGAAAVRERRRDVDAHLRRYEKQIVDAEKGAHDEKVTSDGETVGDFVDEKKPFVDQSEG